VTPVELEGFPSVEHQRNIAPGRQRSLSFLPIPHVPTDAVIATGISFRRQLLEKHNRRPTRPLGKLLVFSQKLLQTLYKYTQNRSGLRPTPIMKRRLITAYRLANRVP
jgi:hypothetical protein